MKQISLNRVLMAGGILLMSGAIAMAQQQPMGSAPQPQNPANNNPNSPMDSLTLILWTGHLVKEDQVSQNCAG